MKTKEVLILENLKCCANCFLFRKRRCPWKAKLDKIKCPHCKGKFIDNYVSSFVCDKWIYDGLTFTDRTLR